MYLALATLLSIFRMVVIPAQFQDRTFGHSYEELSEMISSAQDYYNKEFSDGTLQFEFSLAPIITLNKEISYYGENYSDRKDILLHQAVREACMASEEIDFAQYDNDDDSEVDVLYLLTPGTSEDDSLIPEDLWPQYNNLKENNAVLYTDGKYINKFCCSSENSDFGVFCHELAHHFGLPDLYDSDGESSGGRSEGLKGTALMDEGCKRDEGRNPPPLNAIELEILGLAKIDTLQLGSYELIPESRHFLKATGSNKDEYFLLEANKDNGLYVYYVDKSQNPTGDSDFSRKSLSATQRWELNQVNCRPGMECARLLIPNGNFASDTEPAFVFRNGNSHSLAITDIKRNPADGHISFNVVKPLEITKISVFQDAAIIQWSSDRSLSERASFELNWSSSEEEGSAMIAQGRQSYTIEGLKNNTDYSFKLRMLISEESVYSVSGTFTTKRYRQGTVAYIYLNNTERNVNGSFPVGAKIPLRVFNADNPVKTLWSFNGRAVEADENGFFVVERAGTLKAVVHYEDGSTETIIKEIQVQ